MGKRAKWMQAKLKRGMFEEDLKQTEKQGVFRGRYEVRKEREAQASETIDHVSVSRER